MDDKEAGRMTLQKEDLCPKRDASGPQLPPTGFVRLPGILAPHGPIPVSKSTWWAGIKDGRYPKPVKLGPRITAWRVEDIRSLISEAA
jgi:predicted DNA-binding transcriptional regulator AlpA